MTSLRGLQHHLQSLQDIRAIMSSMKSLAYMETAKLGRIMPSQIAVTDQIEVAAADLLTHYPQVLPHADPVMHVWIALGTERGFCGDLNQQLRKGLEATCPENARILAIGHKLHATLETGEPDRWQPALLDGANVAEEASQVLNQIVRKLDSMQQHYGALAVSAMYHDRQSQLITRELLPSFRQFRQTPVAHVHPPVLNVAPDQLLLDLGDQYLFSALFEILYESLLNENVRRVSHLGDAVRYLDKQLAQLTRRANSLRQEKIIEEIEVLLLSVH